MKKVLVLGGTQFIGRTIVERLLGEQCYDITLFNRQQTNTNLFPELNKIKGDRNTNVGMQLPNQKWDFVIDLSCFFPSTLRRTLAALTERPKKYLFISTCSVYNNVKDQSMCRDENAAILLCNQEESEDVSVSTYGNRKAECERILRDSGLDFIILRPALVYGPHDHTDRLYYWLHQVKTYDKILMPDQGLRKFSMTYVKDLAEMVVQTLNSEISNETYNAISHPTTCISEIIGQVEGILSAKRSYVHAPAEFLHRENISQWTDMPLWLDTDQYTYSNLKYNRSFDSDMDQLNTHLRETIDYYGKRGWDIPKYGIDELKKRSLITKLQKNSSADLNED